MGKNLLFGFKFLLSLVKLETFGHGVDHLLNLTRSDLGKIFIYLSQSFIPGRSISGERSSEATLYN